MQEVADRAHVDTSTVSRMESGKRRLALDHLPALAAALGVSAETLLTRDSSVADPRVRESPRRFGDMTVWPLNRPGSGGRRAYKVNIGAQRRSPPLDLPVHEGEDWIYVLRGPLRLLLGGEEHVLETGEVVEFSTLTPHWFGAVDGPVELILLVGLDGERLHLDPPPS